MTADQPDRTTSTSAARLSWRDRLWCWQTIIRLSLRMGRIPEPEWRAFMTELDRRLAR